MFKEPPGATGNHWVATLGVTFVILETGRPARKEAFGMV